MNGFTLHTQKEVKFISFEELKAQIDNKKSNYKKDVIVGFLDKISLDLIVDYLACKKAGGLPAFLSHPSSKTNKKLFKERINNWKKLGINKFVSSFIENEEHQEEKEISNPKNCSFIQLSSGTTDNQKGFGFTDATLQFQLEYYKNKLNLTKDSVIISWLPVYHDMGLITSIFLPLYVGCNSVIIPTFEWMKDYKIFFDAIKKYDGTHSWLPNFAFELFSKKSNIGEISNSNFKVINCSETCRESSVKNFIEIYKCDVASCYAMAENVFAISQSEDLDAIDGVMNSGVPDGAEVRIGPNDEIQIRGESMFDSLLIDGSLLSQDKRVWYGTGDVGKIQNEKLYIMGREKEIIKVAGKQVFLPDVDSEINKKTDVHKGRVVSCGLDVDGTQKLIVLYEGNKEINKQIRELIYNLFDVSSIVLKVSDGRLIKTSSGKFSRKQNIEIYKLWKLFSSIVHKMSEEKIQFNSKIQSEGLLDSFSIMNLLQTFTLQAGKKINWNYDFSKLDNFETFLEAIE